MTLDELRQLDWKDAGRWPLPVRLGVITAFFVVFAGLMIYFVVWNSKKDELATYESEEQTLRKEFKDKHGKAVNLDLYKQQLEDINKSFGAMLRQLPSKTEVDRLLTDISEKGSSVGCQQRIFDPQPDEIKEFYAVKPIKIRLTCSYHQLGQFVSEIASLTRIVTLHNVSIKAAEKATAFDQLQLDVTARTYRYLDAGEQAAADAERKKAATARGSSST